MKKILVLMFVCLHSIASGQTSDRAYYYEVEFSGDSLNLESKGSEIMVLWSGKDYSVFQSLNGFKSDSIKMEAVALAKKTGQLDPDSFISQISKIRPLFTYMIHKNMRDGSIVMYDKIFRDNYKIEKGFSQLNWELLPETKEIQGFPCHKAIVSYGGREFEAWYTEKIPVNDGPYLFSGLPGLIVEIFDTRQHYSFKLVGVGNREVDLSGLKLTNTISTTKDKYLMARRKAYQNVQAAIGPSPNLNAENLREMQERYNRANNPLELNAQ